MGYRNVQWSPLGVVVAIGELILFVVIVMADAGETPWLVPFLVVFLSAMVGLVVWFSRLEVRVDGEAVHVVFGAGKPHRTFPLHTISQATAVRNKWWYGFGIRRTPQGWMYNAWGLDAVELLLTDGKRFRIGTNDVDGLHSAITGRIGA
ncbi:MAG TPA: hypothetical protein VLA29_12690 [Acidimicrobiia bacterium]|nr:hypothetical protein [Acidimicrobiia bacterium]